jgi:hypothetical protein
MYFKKFEDLTFADHYMFEKVLQNAEICQELLERLLKIKIDHIEYPAIETAKDFLSLGLSIEQVAQGTGLSVDFLKTIK